MKLCVKLALGLISTVFLIGTASAVDQYGKTNSGGTGMMQGSGQAGPVAMANQRLLELKNQLAIRADQAPAWQTFASKVDNQARATESMHEKVLAGMKDTTMTTPDRMAMMADIMKDRAQDMASMAAVVKVFYSKLTPEQKATFDEMHRPHAK